MTANYGVLKNPRGARVFNSKNLITAANNGFIRIYGFREYYVVIIVVIGLSKTAKFRENVR